MGIFSTLVKLTRAKIDTKGNAPGKSVIAQASGVEGQTMTPEVYQAPGVLAVPPDGATGVYVPIGPSGRYGVVIALQNYQITLDLSPGETAIYSTTADGKTVKAKIVLDDAGDIALNGDSKRLVTWQEMNDALQDHKHGAGTLVAPNGAVSGMSGAPVGLDLSAAKTTTIKTGG